MKRSLIETLLGAVVLLLAGFFIFTAYQSSTIASHDGYVLRATFDKIDGVGIGTDVKISGIKVGSITALRLDPETYLATIEMTINDVYRLPTDTVAVVQSEGLLGGSYLSLVPGGSEEMLVPGAVITYTQSPTSLTDLIGRFVFSATGQGKDGKNAAPAPDGGSQGNAGVVPPTRETPPNVAPDAAPETRGPDAGQPQPEQQQDQQDGGGFGLLH
jgi:phospholipid/cholesterol/gamma-HCH transport system substrate-binding protein